jgi:hypothetical protein
MDHAISWADWRTAATFVPEVVAMPWRFEAPTIIDEIREIATSVERQASDLLTKVASQRRSVLTPDVMKAALSPADRAIIRAETARLRRIADLQLDQVETERQALAEIAVGNVRHPRVLRELTADRNASVAFVGKIAGMLDQQTRPAVTANLAPDLTKSADPDLDDLCRAFAKALFPHDIKKDATIRDLTPDQVKRAGPELRFYDPMKRGTMPAVNLLSTADAVKFAQGRGMTVDVGRAGALAPDAVKDVLGPADLSGLKQPPYFAEQGGKAESGPYPFGPAPEAEEAYVADVLRLLPMVEQERTLSEAIDGGRITHPGTFWNVENNPAYSNAFRQRVKDTRQKMLTLAKTSSIAYPHDGGGRGDR